MKELEPNHKSFVDLIDEWPGTLEDLAQALSAEMVKIRKEEGISAGSRFWTGSIANMKTGKNQNPKCLTLKAWARVFKIRWVIQ
jgi:hypothetical protein